MVKDKDKIGIYLVILMQWKELHYILKKTLLFLTKPLNNLFIKSQLFGEQYISLCITLQPNCAYVITLN